MEESESAMSARHSRYQVSPSDFDLVALAGRGAFGKVWVVRKKNDYSGKVMAMKEMNKADMISRGYVTHTKQEKDIMATVGDFPFIVDLYFTFHSELNIYIIMEYVPGGNLLSYVMDTDKPWPEDKCQFYGAEILLALEHIHSKNIVYKDLKLENVLLDMDGHVRLTDFGLSKQLSDENDRVHSMSGTAAYLAPEVIDSGDNGHGKSADIWAFGVLMFTVLLHESPFYSENLSELFEMIVNQEVEWEYYKEDLSPEAYSLLQGLLIKDPAQRLGCGPTEIQEIKEHPFFSTLNWDDLLAMKIKPLIKPKLRVAERATEQDKQDLQSGRVSKQNADRGEFSDFSFVAADYIQHTAMDPTDEISSNWSISDEEEVFAWPFADGLLPFSAVNQIVRYLSISDISRASQVCKSWNKFLWSNIHELDLSTVQPELFEQYWHSHICKVLKRPMRLLKIRMNPCCTDASIAKLPIITALETISFAGCSAITLNGISNLAKGNTKQTSIRTKKLKFPMLAELDLSQCESIDDSAIEQIARTVPQLKQLNLAFSTSITDTGLAHMQRLQSMWRLDLQGVTNLTDNGIKQLVDVPNLRVLELSGCINLTSAGVESLRTKAKQLEVLIWSDTLPNVVDAPEVEKATKGFAGLFSKKGSIFKVSRGEGKGASTDRIKASKNFLPSFKRKKASNLKITFGHRKSSSGDVEGSPSFTPGYADEAEEEILLSPRSRGAKKREKKLKEKEKAKERKSKKKESDISPVVEMASPTTRVKKEKKTKADRAKSFNASSVKSPKVEHIKRKDKEKGKDIGEEKKEFEKDDGTVSPEVKHRLHKSILERHKKRKELKKLEKVKYSPIGVDILNSPRSEELDLEDAIESSSGITKDDSDVPLKNNKTTGQDQESKKQRPKSVEISSDKDLICVSRKEEPKSKSKNPKERRGRGDESNPSPKRSKSKERQQKDEIDISSLPKDNFLHKSDYDSSKDETVTPRTASRSKTPKEKNARKIVEDNHLIGVSGVNDSKQTDKLFDTENEATEELKVEQKEIVPEETAKPHDEPNLSFTESEAKNPAPEGPVAAITDLETKKVSDKPVVSSNNPIKSVSDDSDKSIVSNSINDPVKSVPEEATESKPTRSEYENAIVEEPTKSVKDIIKEATKAQESAANTSIKKAVLPTKEVPSSNATATTGNSLSAPNTPSKPIATLPAIQKHKTPFKRLATPGQTDSLSGEATRAILAQKIEISRPSISTSDECVAKKKPLLDEELADAAGKRSSLVLQRKAAFEAIGVVEPPPKITLPARKSPRRMPPQKAKPTQTKAEDKVELLKILGENPAKAKITKPDDSNTGAERSVSAIASLWSGTPK